MKADPPTPRGVLREANGNALLVWLLGALFLTLLVRTAWVCDDAYITFRVVDNLWNGHGLRWNADERVQSYTNPLWMLVMAVCYGPTRDVYYTSLGVSIAFSLWTAWLLVARIALTPLHALLALWTLILSKAFVDYSTGGLENPLQHLLLALFALDYFAGPNRERRLARLALLAGLSSLNRLDSLVLLLPPLLAAATASPPRRAARALLLGALLPLAWTGFSVFYYGFPLPNTAYAKLNTGIPALELAQQGVYYLFNSLSIDPVTLVGVALGLTLPLGFGPARALPFSAGILLYLAYVVRIGGDFMAGRFMAAPLLAAAIVLARVPMPLTATSFSLTFLTLGAVALSSPVPNLSTTAFFFTDRWERRTLLDERGITDERAIYYRYTGLLTARRGEPMPNHHRAVEGRRLRAEGRTLFHHGQIGILGFYAGPGVHIYEANALSDAFLARLPARPGWRIGHFVRTFPSGYEGSLRRGVNRISDPELRVLFRELRLVTRGPLLDPDRLAAIWDLNFGAGRRLGSEYFAVHSRQRRLTLADVAVPRQDGDDWREATRFGERGVEVALGRLRHPRRVELSLDSNDTYALGCLSRGVLLGEVRVEPRGVPGGGLSVRRVDLKPETARWGCDSLRIVPVSGDQDYSLGHVAILDEMTEQELAAPDAATSGPETPEPDAPDDGKEGKQDDGLPGGR